VKIIKDEQSGQNTVSSYIAFTAHDDELIGINAKFNEHTNPKEIIYNAKRFIGRTIDDPIVKELIPNHPFEVTEQDHKLVFNTSRGNYEPAHISSKILKKMKNTAEEYLQQCVTSAVITIPASFTKEQRQETERAAQIAELEVLELLKEPTAAALAYKLKIRSEEPQTLLVFDLGGGTFNVAIIDGENIEKLAGDNYLGGEDFDINLFNYCIEQFEKQHKLRVDKSPLGEKCETAKISLSAARIASIAIDGWYQGKDLKVNLTRSKFEQLNMHLFEKTIQIVKTTLEEANISTDRIDSVIMAGGSSRIPKIREMLSDLFTESELIDGMNFDEIVAHGAALRAAQILRSGESQESNKNPSSSFSTTAEASIQPTDGDKDNTSTDESTQPTDGDKDNTSTEESTQPTDGGKDKTDIEESRRTTDGGKDNTSTEESRQLTYGSEDNTSTEESRQLTYGNEDKKSTEESRQLSVGSKGNIIAVDSFQSPDRSNIVSPQQQTSSTRESKDNTTVPKAAENTSSFVSSTDKVSVENNTSTSETRYIQEQTATYNINAISRNNIACFANPCDIRKMKLYIVKWLKKHEVPGAEEKVKQFFDPMEPAFKELNKMTKALDKEMDEKRYADPVKLLNMQGHWKPKVLTPLRNMSEHKELLLQIFEYMTNRYAQENEKIRVEENQLSKKVSRTIVEFYEESLKTIAATSNKNDVQKLRNSVIMAFKTALDENTNPSLYKQQLEDLENQLKTQHNTKDTLEKSSRKANSLTSHDEKQDTSALENGKKKDSNVEDNEDAISSDHNCLAPCTASKFEIDIAIHIGYDTVHWQWQSTDQKDGAEKKNRPVCAVRNQISIHKDQVYVGGCDQLESEQIFLNSFLLDTIKTHKIILGGENWEFNMVTCYALVFQNILKDIAPAKDSVEVRQCVIAVNTGAVPSYREVIMKAAEFVKLRPVCILNEATAAALLYFTSNPKPEDIKKSVTVELKNDKIHQKTFFEFQKNELRMVKFDTKTVPGDDPSFFSLNTKEHGKKILKDDDIKNNPVINCNEDAAQMPVSVVSGAVLWASSLHSKTKITMREIPTYSLYVSAEILQKWILQSNQPSSPIEEIIQISKNSKKLLVIVKENNQRRQFHIPCKEGQDSLDWKVELERNSILKIQGAGYTGEKDGTVMDLTLPSIQQITKFCEFCRDKRLARAELKRIKP